jgi:hypothetical protein
VEQKWAQLDSGRMKGCAERIGKKRRKSMKKQVFAIAAVTALMTLAPAPSHAQQVSQANIPFAFQAGNTSMPAGEYKVLRALPDSETVQQIRRTDSSAATLVHTSASDLRQDDAGPKLIFHCYAKQCFLSEIWVGEGRVLKLTQSGRERELSQVKAEAELAVVSVPLADVQ